MIIENSYGHVDYNQLVDICTALPVLVKPILFKGTVIAVFEVINKTVIHHKKTTGDGTITLEPIQHEMLEYFVK